MGSRLYVGNLSYSTTEQQLRTAFEPFGQVVSATIVLDKMSGRSRGFGFVEYGTDAEAQKAIEAMHGADLEGRNLTVNEARARTEGPGRGQGGFRPNRGPREGAPPPADAPGPSRGGGRDGRGGRRGGRSDRDRNRGGDDDF